MELLRIGTRGSALARRQTDLVVQALQAAAPGTKVEVVAVQTEGDRRIDVSLDVFGGQGVFVKEIEQRLIDGDIDLAVHSLKDMPAQSPDALVIGAVLPRADARDALITRAGLDLAALSPHPRIGSDSSRRACQLRALRPDVEIATIRGNVDTRLRKVDAGDYDAVVLAAAGLERLGLLHRTAHIFSIDEMLPAPGQGALAVQCRAADKDLRALLSAVDDALTRTATDGERSFLRALGAGCSLPIAAHATATAAAVHLDALIASSDGRLHRGSRDGPIADAAPLGESLAHELGREAGL